ncbi:YkuS family protein [Paenibacillus chartarius]|uniref:YkuS family protein n=1 Tax=Paenibacillus chartarius TaxID=747481 RepID=A0ABV6DF33_9BACL
MAKVAVENGLGTFKEALQQNGFEVVGMENAGNAACCVISGQDKNVMGIADTYTQASVINCEGLSPDEVVRQVSSRVNAAQ